MADGKWIEGLSASMPLHEAAVPILRTRLGAVVKAWKPALDTVGDAEPVHHLRVACRRANAAVRILKDILPTRRRKKLADLVRELRQRAGEVRDADVLLATLKDGDFLAGQVFAERCRSVRQLAKFKRDFRSIERMAEIVDHWSIEHVKETLGERALDKLPKLIDQFQTALDVEDDDKALHQARIQGKRLRYALELFAPCFDMNNVMEVYRPLEEIQELLGTINDRRVAIDRIDGVVEELQTLSSDIRNRHAASLKRVKQRFEREATDARGQLAEWRTNWNNLEASSMFTTLAMSAGPHSDSAAAESNRTEA